jgi:DNA replication and repair protein RecF
MALSHLEISNFRNLLSAQIQPITQGFNFIIGSNGSGKTSLLEAIYYLSLGRSFRSSIADRIVNSSAQKLSLFANAASGQASYDAIGLERHAEGGLKIRINGKDALSITDSASLLPVQLMDSNCHHLLDGGPAIRRKLLDWGIFYKNPDFLSSWRQFERLLRQRNAALRGQRARKELSAWTSELILHALSMDEMRRQYVDQFIPCLQATIAELLDIADLKISYLPGWDQTQTYASILERSLDKDFQLGYTQYGPQKADLKILINGVPAKDILSRGQQKLFVCAMIIARGTLLQSGTKRRPVYLVDDLPSELDVTSRSKLLALLSKQEAQIFVTAVDRDSLGSSIANEFIKMFHVEHGNVSEVSGRAILPLSQGHVYNSLD